MLRYIKTGMMLLSIAYIVIGKMLLVLKEQGEDAAFDYVRALLREEKQCPTK